MIGRKNRFEQAREVTEQRFLGTNLPVVRQVDPSAILLERPDAAPDEITKSLKGVPIRFARVGDTKLPPQGVGEPSRVEQNRLSTFAT